MVHISCVGKTCPGPVTLGAPHYQPISEVSQWSEDLLNEPIQEGPGP